ncbi:uncharacterized protein [Epargyreus clarus]|uniref:uncharacterized protein isoform X2 n=1 Tax=Epargyreus clarus TaxID=520877 RepID=UPI003C2CCB58
MACCKEEMEYNDATETLANTFGSLLSRDVIYTIVESCSGDLNHAANAIMSITSEENAGRSPVQHSPTQTHHKQSSRSHGRPVTKKSPKSNKQSQSTSKGNNASTSNANQTNSNLYSSYANASSSNNKGAIPKQTHKYPQILPKRAPNGFNLWTDQVRRIVTYHNQGTRTLIIMRGAPGSGKSYLARQILEITIGSKVEQQHIFSTDDYFMMGGNYRYDKTRLQDAHIWNQRKVFDALDKGISPVIIDNTNVEYWEIEPYARTGVYNGYLLEVVEPNTTWARNLYQLASRNLHGVPAPNIKRMLDNISTIPISSATLISNLKLAYPENMKPPVLRCLPKFQSTDKDSNPSQVKEVLKSESTEQFPQVQKTNIPNEKSETNTQVNLKDQKKDPSVVMDTTTQSLNVEKEDNVFIQAIKNNKSNELKSTDLGEKNMKMNEEKLLTKKVENLAIDREENINHYGEVKVSTVKIPQSNSANSIDNSNSLFQQSKSTENVDDAVLLKESTNFQTTKSIDLKGEEVKFRNQLEEFEKVENAWDNGEAWEEDSKAVSTATEPKISYDAKPPRKRKPLDKDNSLSSFTSENDWKKLSMYMPSWSDNNTLCLEPSKHVVETKSIGTCVEVGDTEISRNQYKIISTIARDININYIPYYNEKIPENRMLDKSSMTNEPTSIVGAYRCKNEEKHFIRFRNMFKNLNKEDLKDIFDKCCGDVNWAVSIVLDDMANKEIKSISVDERSDTEDETDEPCECTAHYDIIPDNTPSITSGTQDEQVLDSMPSTSSGNDSFNLIRKQKKEFPLSDTSLALKRQIEQNIVISDQFYSQECLKVRKMRRGELDGDVSTSQITYTANDMQNINYSDNTELIPINRLNSDIADKDSALSTLDLPDTEYESDEDLCLNEVEKTVNINLGREFLNQLDTLFGRGDMVYSDNIEPRVNMPLSILNEINALWMESLMHQLEAESKCHEEMIKQDEQLAREIAMKQAEVSQMGKEPEVPDFKEIMDMEFALSLYHKDCNEWKNEKPKDLATMLSTQKLHNLFPEIPPADLDEIHNAHNYDFQKTVKVVLRATNRNDIVEEENGVNKFVMSEELRRQEKFLAEEKEKLSDMMKWPALPSKISLDIVGKYRQIATAHFEKRLISYVKAADFLNQGMLTVANYYSDIATFHTMKYEQAQSVAAATLMQFHASKCVNASTLDLHYLRVNEAKEALDMFLDSHIQNLREKNIRKKLALFFITGRGLHSQGGPKIKPAVRKRLMERGLICSVPKIKRQDG